MAAPKSQVMSYWESCPAKVRLCPTHPHGGMRVAIFQDGGLRRATNPYVGCGKSQNSKLGYVLPRAFAPLFWGVQHIASRKLGSVLQCFRLVWVHVPKK